MYPYGYYYDYSYLIFILPAILISMWAQSKINGAYQRFSREKADFSMTGDQVAKAILNQNGIYDISIVPIRGVLTDNYDRINSRISLSEGVFGKNSIAAIAIAAHEASHAVQMEEGYLPIKIRHSMAKVTQFASSASFFLILLGFIDMIFLRIGIIMFLIIFLFQLVTLPVEINASRRALEELESLGISQSDRDKSYMMLRAAAYTYIAATLTALAQVLRMISITNDRRR